MRKDQKKKILLAERLFDLSSEKEDLQGDLPQVLHDLDRGHYGSSQSKSI